MFKKFGWNRLGLFVGGVIFGSIGLKALSSKDAKKVYTHLTAAALRAKDYTVKRTEEIKENMEDIYEDAKDINEERAAEEAVVGEDDFREVETEEVEVEE